MKERNGPSSSHRCGSCDMSVVMKPWHRDREEIAWWI